MTHEAMRMKRFVVDHFIKLIGISIFFFLVWGGWLFHLNPRIDTEYRMAYHWPARGNTDRNIVSPSLVQSIFCITNGVFCAMCHISRHGILFDKSTSGAKLHLVNLWMVRDHLLFSSDYG